MFDLMEENLLWEENKCNVYLKFPMTVVKQSFNMSSMDVIYLYERMYVYIVIF